MVYMGWGPPRGVAMAMAERAVITLQSTTDFFSHSHTSHYINSSTIVNITVITKVMCKITTESMQSTPRPSVTDSPSFPTHTHIPSLPSLTLHPPSLPSLPSLTLHPPSPHSQTPLRLPLRRLVCDKDPIGLLRGDSSTGWGYEFFFCRLSTSGGLMNVCVGSFARCITLAAEESTDCIAAATGSLASYA